MRKSLFIVLSIAVLWAFALYFNQMEKGGPVGVKQGAESAKGVKKAQTEELPRIGFKAPQIELKGLDEKSYSLKDPKGKPVILNFWASWCGPCKLEAPMLVRYYKKYQEKIEIYAINLTSNDSAQDAKKFAEKYGFAFPVLLDTEGKAANLYQVQAIPTSFFINKDGVIIDQIIGLADPKTLDDKIQKAIAAE